MTANGWNYGTGDGRGDSTRPGLGTGDARAEAGWTQNPNTRGHPPTNRKRNNDMTTETAPMTEIVILQRGWVYIGLWSQDGDDCRLDSAMNIRRWGTSEGLGELRTGPTATTQLDKCGVVKFHTQSVVARIEVDATVWAPILAEVG